MGWVARAPLHPGCRASQLPSPEERKRERERARGKREMGSCLGLPETGRGAGVGAHRALAPVLPACCCCCCLVLLLLLPRVAAARCCCRSACVRSVVLSLLLVLVLPLGGGAAALRRCPHACWVPGTPPPPLSARRRWGLRVAARQRCLPVPLHPAAGGPGCTALCHPPSPLAGR